MLKRNSGDNLMRATASSKPLIITIIMIMMLMIIMNYKINCPVDENNRVGI